MSALPYKTAVLIVFTCFVNTASACPNQSANCKIGKKEWQGHMKSGIPAFFCRDDSSFMQCYEMSQSKCLSLSLSLTKQCIAKSEKDLPSFFDKQSSEHWGSIVGGCAGGKLTDLVKLKKGKKAGCLLEDPLQATK